mmetsp:Transcript_139085/g.444222  ORF Transcript_139085/g.444222 Transcript_139085/m.444222 type:complete len:122 (+) Transcript_139085:3707-4072(+)
MAADGPWCVVRRLATAASCHTIGITARWGRSHTSNGCPLIASASGGSSCSTTSSGCPIFTTAGLRVAGGSGNKVRSRGRDVGCDGAPAGHAATNPSEYTGPDLPKLADKNSQRRSSGTKLC